MMREEETTLTERLQSYPATCKPQPQSICTRCGGLMVSDVCMDLMNSTSELECTARRCVQCGDVIDAVILRNRSLHQQSMTTQRQPASVHSVETDSLARKYAYETAFTLKEDVMTTQRTLTVGCLAAMTLVGLTLITPSFAAHPDRVDVISYLSEKVAQLDSNKDGAQPKRVDMIGSIGSQGPAYPYVKPTNR